MRTAVKVLLAINHAYLFFGATVYVGVLWSLHFFWYPSWRTMTLDMVQTQFILPTSAATRFFTVVVPLMFVTNGVLIVMERKTKLLWLAILAFLCVAGATFVGQVYIIPVNRTIGAATDPTTLTALFQRWMTLNDIRWLIMTLMWLTMMTYFVLKGRLLDTIAGEKVDAPS